jgi:UDP-glucose 4-epimerase
MSNYSFAITGANGYIGSSLAKFLKEKSHDVTGISRSRFKHFPGKKLICKDIKKYETWLEILKFNNVIFHLAGNTSVYTSEVNPEESLLSTLLPIEHLIRAAKELKVKPRIVFTSTATVYGVLPKLPVSEHQKPKPVTTYDIHKLFAEQLLAIASEARIIDAVSLRLSNVFGPSPIASSSNDRGILNKSVVKALENNNLNYYGHGNYLRDYVYITDVVNALYLAGISDDFHGKVFNIGSGIGTSIKKAMQTVVKLTNKTAGKSITAESVPWPLDMASIEYRYFVSKIDNFSKKTGWKPKINFCKGIELLIQSEINKK